MDRKVAPEQQKKKKNKRIRKIGFWVFVFISAIISLRFVIQPTIKKTDFYTSIVEIGDIEASVSSSGTVLPEFEEIKTSPIHSQIIKIHHNVGDKVKPGDSILSLDKKSTKLALEKLEDELKMKKNNVQQRKLELERSLIDLKTQYEIKKLQVENQTARLTDEKYLKKIGGGTNEQIGKAELALKISKLELDQIRKNILNKEKSMQADLLGLNYEISIQQKSVNELRNKLNQATIITSNQGVITWINDKVGKNINLGDELVKIANLQSFEVKGSISDMHADKLNVGKEVNIRIKEGVEIRGEIVSISPSVEGNVIQYKIRLNEKSHDLLRPNLKVDVFVITSFKENILRVKNGAFYKGAKKQIVFIVRDNELIRQEVLLGESNFDYVEVKSGLSNNDEIVVSDMSEYENKKVLKIK